MPLPVEGDEGADTVGAGLAGGVVVGAVGVAFLPPPGVWAWPPPPPRPPPPRWGWPALPLGTEPAGAGRAGLTTMSRPPGCSCSGFRGEGAALGVASSTFVPGAERAPWPTGQTLKDASPTSVTKTIAAPASRIPEAPTPTMNVSGVLLVEILEAA